MKTPNEVPNLSDEQVEALNDQQRVDTELFASYVQIVKDNAAAEIKRIESLTQKEREYFMTRIHLGDAPEDILTSIRDLRYSQTE